MRSAEQKRPHDVHDERRPRPARWSDTGDVRQPARAAVPPRRRRKRPPTPGCHGRTTASPLTVGDHRQQGRKYRPPRGRIAPWWLIPAPVFAAPEDLIDVPHLVTAYSHGHPDPDDVGPAGGVPGPRHRGSSPDGAFNEAHIPATTQAIVEYRRRAGDHRSVVHRLRHPRPVRAGLGVGAGGAGRQ